MLVSVLTMFLSAPIAGRVTRMMDPRLAMFGGFSGAAWAIGLGARVTDQWGFSEFMVLQIARGLGTMIAMIASQQMTISTLPVGLMKDASGLINLIRNVAGAIGLAMLTTILDHQGAVHFADLAAKLSTANPVGQDMPQGLTAMMRASGMADPEGGAGKPYSMMMTRQGWGVSLRPA